MLRWQDKTLTKIISLILIQSFLFTGVIYPESINNKDIAEIYKIDSDLRVPMGFSNRKSQADDTESDADGLAERMLAGLDELAGQDLQYGLKKGYIPEKDEPYFYELIDMFKEGGIGKSNSERLARSLVKMRNGGLEMIYLLKVINEKEKQILLNKDLEKLKALSAAEKSDFVKRFKDLADSYNNSLARTQREVFMLRLVPIYILRQLADRYNCSRTTVISAIMKHGNFHIWMKNAYSKVNEIKDIVGGSTNAWQIVLSQGIENTDEWVKKAGLKVDELRRTIKGLSGHEWFIVIAQGLGGVDAWIEKGRRKVSEIEGIVGGASRAWEIVIAQGLDNVDDWLVMAKVKVASIRGRVGNDTMAWAIVTKHTLSEIDRWVKDAEAIVERIKDVVGGKNNAWFIVSAQGLDDAEAWAKRAKLKADSIKDETGGYAYAWQIIIGQGIEKVDNWMDRARPKISQIKIDFEIDNTTAWQVVIAQGLDGVDSWLREAKTKVDNVQKIVNARSIAWKIVIAYGIDKSEDWAKKADEKANEIKDKVGGYRNALFVAINYGLDKADTWVKEAELKVDDIEKVVGARSIAWKIVMEHGLDELDDWMEKAKNKVEYIMKRVAGGRYNAWVIIASQGLENVDSWLTKAQKKVDEIKETVGSNSNAWMIVIRQNLENVDNWVRMAKTKVDAIQNIVGGERNAWLVVIRQGIDSAPAAIEDKLQSRIYFIEQMIKESGRKELTEKLPYIERLYHYVRQFYEKDGLIEKGYHRFAHNMETTQLDLESALARADGFTDQMLFESVSAGILHDFVPGRKVDDFPKVPDTIEFIQNLDEKKQREIFGATWQEMGVDISHIIVYIARTDYGDKPEDAQRIEKAYAEALEKIGIDIKEKINKLAVMLHDADLLATYLLLTPEEAEERIRDLAYEKYLNADALVSGTSSFIENVVMPAFKRLPEVLQNKYQAQLDEVKRHFENVRAEPIINNLPSRAVLSGV